ncbi:hypothetical protein DM2_502 [Halorubrum sp. DM2]|nr:hypothetical protein DM2_502 [Halorubrum sp. DM2]
MEPRGHDAYLRITARPPNGYSCILQSFKYYLRFRNGERRSDRSEERL